MECTNVINGKMIIESYEILMGDVIYTHTDEGECEYHEYKCRKGLWTVGSAVKEQALYDALHYYEQYLQDGEYVQV
jgi:hypothetical protein